MEVGQGPNKGCSAKGKKIIFLFDWKVVKYENVSVACIILRDKLYSQSTLLIGNEVKLSLSSAVASGRADG
jgi:hypothetical protein